MENDTIDIKLNKEEIVWLDDQLFQFNQDRNDGNVDTLFDFEDNLYKRVDLVKLSIQGSREFRALYTKLHLERTVKEVDKTIRNEEQLKLRLEKKLR